MQYIDICDGNMQDGSFRCDANVSVRPIRQKKLGTRTELKNINSFKFLEKAINFEVARQQDILANGGSIIQETRLYDSVKQQTRSMRSKEEANDYRYFPDPDLLPIKISDELLAKIKAQLPELPAEKKIRFMQDFGLSEYDADVLTSQKPLAHYFETMLKDNQANVKLCANWVLGELSAALKKYQKTIENSLVSAQDLSLLVMRISDNSISGKIAKEVFKAMWNGQGNADEIIRAQGLKQLSNTDEIEVIVDKIIADNRAQVEQLRAGNKKILGFLVGQAMKATGGKVNPELLNKTLKEKIKPVTITQPDKI